jgi:hypothetical protein
VEQERGTLERREPLQGQHQCEGKIIRQFGRSLRRQGVRVEHRLRQPGPDIEFPPGPRALEAVEAKPGYDSDQESFGVADVVGAGNAKIGVLHHVFRVAAAPEHAIGKPEQPPAMRRKRVALRRLA